MIKKILLALVVLVLVLVGVVAMQPAEYRLTRSAEIAAPASVVFAQVDDFHKWEAWSPWAKIDPACKNTFEGPTSGVGASFAWDGNDKVGKGKMTITEARPAELVRIKLDFIKPYENTCTADFTFKESGGKTRVSWEMYGRHSFMEKGFCMFMNMDKMVGPDFEKGLASLKAVSEVAAK